MSYLHRLALVFLMDVNYISTELRCMPSQQAQLGPTSDFVGIRGLNWACVLGGPFTWYGVGPTWAHGQCYKYS